MPPQVRRTRCTRASQASVRRSQGTPSRSAMQSGSGSRAVSPDGKRLRSRVVPAPSSSSSPRSPRSSPRVPRAARGVPLGPVQGRRRSRSAASSRASETVLKNKVRKAPNTRSGRTVQTRSTEREMRIGRMSLGTAINHRTPDVAKAVEQQASRRLAAATRACRATPTTRRLRKTQPSKPSNCDNERLFKDVQQQPICCQVAGCAVKLLPVDMDKHLQECPLRIPCPLVDKENCKWGGGLSQIAAHITKDHRSVNCKTGPTVTSTIKNWKRATPSNWITLQTCLGHNFLVIFQKEDKNRCPFFSGTVFFVGEQEDADRFEFRMSLRSSNPSLGRKSFAYSTVVKPLDDSLAGEDSFKFDSSYAELFSYEDKLEVEVSISVMKM